MLTESELERFWSKVDVGRLEDCWPWQASCKVEGHGRFKLRGKDVGAHRVALMSTGVNIERLIVRHMCSSASCCNPSHLKVGDSWDNIQDRIDAGRSAKGEDNGRARLTEAKVIEMRGDTRPHYQYAKKYGVDVTTISLARRGITWAFLNEKHPPITKTDTP